jgi:hypothetical protein
MPPSKGNCWNFHSPKQPSPHRLPKQLPLFGGNGAGPEVRVRAVAIGSILPKVFHTVPPYDPGQLASQDEPQDGTAAVQNS